MHSRLRITKLRIAPYASRFTHHVPNFKEVSPKNNANW
jgi:hypothetical protein